MSEERLDAFTVRKMLDYDPETGIFIWKWHPSPYCRRYIGKEAGSIDRSIGYAQISLFGRNYKAHRVAYLLQMGHWPFKHIDHKNGNTLDNRWANIRAATHSQNMANRKVGKNNKVGLKGVSLASESHRRKSKYSVQVKYNGKYYYGGYHATIEEAKAARDALAKRLHGDFFRP